MKIKVLAKGAKIGPASFEYEPGYEFISDPTCSEYDWLVVYDELPGRRGRRPLPRPTPHTHGRARRAHGDAHGNAGRPRICRTAHGGARFSATRRGRRGYFARQAEFKWGQAPSPHLKPKNNRK